MNTETLTCNSCGAPLEVPESANFVTCNHCSCQLAIRRSETATFTEQLDRLTEQTEQLSSRVDRLSSQTELAALDHAWSIERETYMVSGKDGRRSIPTQTGSLVGGIFAAVFGVFWMIMASNVAGGIFPLFGLFFIVLGVGGAMSGFTKASRYQQAEQKYQRRRGELQAGLSR